MLGIVYPWNLEPYKTNMATQNHAGLEELFPLESGGILALSTPLWVCLKEGCIKLGWAILGAIRIPDWANLSKF